MPWHLRLPSPSAAQERFVKFATGKERNLIASRMLTPMSAFCRKLVRCYSAREIGRSQLRVCIIGSGPAGFYTAHQLIKLNEDTHVDIFERLPVPFGLVRFGVAPDHSEVKNCINQFTALAQSGHCRFIGNVCLGKDVTLSHLRPHYHAVVMAYGTEDNRVLGIPGEDLPGVYSARAFFGWYNGLPAYTNLNPDISGETAVVVGQGNVAIDVARILLTPIDCLKTTDICQHALEQLAESKIRRVQLVGRRGPLQVAFTIKELREMTKLAGCRTILETKDFDQCRELMSSLPRPRKRLTELMINTAEYVKPRVESQRLMEGLKEEGKREWGLSFLRSPVELLADETSGHVSSVKLEINQLEGEWMAASAIGTGEHETMNCNMVLRSIGYKTLPVDKEVPVDPEKGIIPNIAGRVIGRDGATLPGLYCSGWVKTGPVQGIVLNTMGYAFETAEMIIDDYKQGNLKTPSERSDILEMLSGISGLEPSSFSNWEAIDTVEKEVGQRCGKPREKVVTVENMMDIVRQRQRQS